MFRTISYLFVAGTFLFQFSCVSTITGAKVANQTGIVTSPLRGLAFQSDEYVVYRLEGTETPAMLSKAYLGNPNSAWLIEDENKETPFKRGQRIVIPLKDRKKGGLSLKGYQVVPILCYHHFAEKCKTSLCVSSKNFKNQMEYLKANKYRVISLMELLGFLQYRHGLPEKSVLLTFDDGYRSFYETAYPILQSYGFKGVLFVYTDFIESSKNALTWDQLKALKAEGFEIGGHGLSHIDFTKKSKGEDNKAYMERIKNELTRSKKIIDEKLEQDTIFLAFPFGNYNQEIIHLSEQAGYKIGLSVKRGSNPFFADPLALKRCQILKKDMKNFISTLKTFEKLSLK